MFSDPDSRHSLALLALRIVLGVIFIYHGVDKITGKQNVWGAGWATQLSLQSSEVPPEVVAKLNQWVDLQQQRAQDVPADVMERQMDLAERIKSAYAQVAWAGIHSTDTGPGAAHLHAGAQLAVAWGELLGGLALLLGTFTRVAALGMIIIQVGAIMLVTGPRGFSYLGGGGYEFNVALLAMCAVLLILGAGAWALDPYLSAWRKKTFAAQASKAPPQPVAVGGV
jgi:uncharacterized membrane protein YphA (DoxX/SURF4 family)